MNFIENCQLKTVNSPFLPFVAAIFCIWRACCCRFSFFLRTQTAASLLVVAAHRDFDKRRQQACSWLPFTANKKPLSFGEGLAIMLSFHRWAYLPSKSSSCRIVPLPRSD